MVGVERALRLVNAAIWITVRELCTAINAALKIFNKKRHRIRIRTGSSVRFPSSVPCFLVCTPLSLCFNNPRWRDIFCFSAFKTQNMPLLWALKVSFYPLPISPETDLLSYGNVASAEVARFPLPLALQPVSPSRPSASV